MARPRKTSLTYFPFDVDFFDDERVVCIAGEFGLKGEITLVKLLCAVYRKGYFLEWNEMVKFKLLKDLPGISAELLDQIIERLVKWGFFDENLFNSAHILTSGSIQQTYFEALKRNLPQSDLPHLLGFLQHNVSETAVSVTKTLENVAETPPNKRKEKENKRKQKREKEKREKDAPAPSVKIESFSGSAEATPLITREEILAAIREHQFADYGAAKTDGEDFYDYYSARGWCMSFGVKMQDWRAAFRSWLTKKNKFGSSTRPGAKQKTTSAPQTPSTSPSEPGERKATAEEIAQIIKESGFNVP